MNINLIESAPSMFALAEDALTEAERQFAAAEITEGALSWMFVRGGWHMLLLWAEATYLGPYCAKLASPCPDDCAGLKVQCSDRLHGDCWRVKQPAC